MRMNRGTIILIVVSIAVIIGVLAINNNPTSAPGNTTPTASAQTGGPLFPGADASTLVRFEVRDNTTGARTVLTRNEADVWGLDESDQPGAGDVTSDALSGVVAEATDEAGGTTAVSPQDAFSIQTTSGQSLDQNVILTDIGSFLGLNATDSFTSDQLADFELDHPHYSILAAAADGTVYQLHVGGQNPTGIRYYAVLEPLAGADIATEEVSLTEEPGAALEATIAANVATDEAQPAETAPAEGTPEATEAAVSAEATEPAAPVFATPTLAPLAEPLVSLQGTQTIYTLPKTTLDTLIGLITTIPFATPTAVPASQVPLPEATVELVPAVETTAEAEATAAP
jgi:hypothetical protein